MIKTRNIHEDEQLSAIRDLDIYGYSIIKNYIDSNLVEKLLLMVESEYKKINENGKVTYGGVPSRDKDDKIIYNLHNIDNLFIDFLVTPFIKRIGKEKLNDEHYRFLDKEISNYILLYFNARSSGQKLDLHIDSHIPFIGSKTNMMQFVMLLEDSNVENGCTTIVPGSHNSGRFTDRELTNVVPLEGKAGDLIFWDSRVWHGANKNLSGKSRWAIIATLGMWWIKPSMDIVRGMNESIYQKCSNEQKQLLGFCAIPPTNPVERTNTKCGYDFLKQTVKDYFD